MKFKVGDTVRLIGDEKSVSSKRNEYGKIATIEKVYGGFSYPYVMKEPYDTHAWCDSELELVEQHKIIITTDGVKITTAKLYEDGKCVKTAEAKCAPEDNFDFMVGAKLACERLNTPKPKYYNGKVVCIKSGYDWFTVGKVYKVKNGIIFADNGYRYPRLNHTPYRDAEDVRHAGCSVNCDAGRHNMKNEFIPLVED